MTDIIDFTNCELSSRNLSYAGRAGEKRGIKYKDQLWILKFPKNTKGMDKVNNSYTTSPLSEYIGSKIYEILGYDVHKTILGICNDGKRDKIVCACKDFISNDKNEVLIPYTALRNDTSIAVMNREEEDLSASASNLKDILFQLNNNEVLSKLKDAKTRFWDTVVIDILINNNDRNEDNWGVIKYKNENKYVLAPIYDNGNCFYNKADDERIKLIMANEERLISSALNGITAYEDNDEKRITAKEMINLNNKDLKDAIKRIISKISVHIDEIKALIDNIPESYKGIPIISKIKKEYYFKTIQLRLAYLSACKNAK